MGNLRLPQEFHQPGVVTARLASKPKACNRTIASIQQDKVKVQHSCAFSTDTDNCVSDDCEGGAVHA